jgi:hypothetical protein
MIKPENRVKILKVLDGQDFCDDRLKKQLVDTVLNNLENTPMPGENMDIYAIATARLINAILARPDWEDEVAGLPANSDTLLHNNYIFVLAEGKRNGGCMAALKDKTIWQRLTLASEQ